MTANDTAGTAATITVPEHYADVYQTPAYHLLQAGDTAPEGAAKYLVACTAHGTTTEAETKAAGYNLGRKADRATWCEGCKAAAKDAPAATPGGLRVAVSLVVELPEGTAPWLATGPETPAVDLAVITAALVGTGLPEDQAKAMAARMAAPEDGPTAAELRTQVREYVLAQVLGLDRLVAAKATVALYGQDGPAATATAPAPAEDAPEAPAPAPAPEGKAKK